LAQRRSSELHQSCWRVDDAPAGPAVDLHDDGPDERDEDFPAFGRLERQPRAGRGFLELLDGAELRAASVLAGPTLQLVRPPEIRPRLRQALGLHAERAAGQVAGRLDVPDSFERHQPAPGGGPAGRDLQVPAPISKDPDEPLARFEGVSGVGDPFYGDLSVQSVGTVNVADREQLIPDADVDFLSADGGGGADEGAQGADGAALAADQASPLPCRNGNPVGRAPRLGDLDDAGLGGMVGELPDDGLDQAPDRRAVLGGAGAHEAAGADVAGAGAGAAACGFSSRERTVEETAAPFPIQDRARSRSTRKEAAPATRASEPNSSSTFARAVSRESDTTTR